MDDRQKEKMEDNLIHLPCPEEIYIEAFKCRSSYKLHAYNSDLSVQNKQEAIINTNLNTKTNTRNNIEINYDRMYLQQSHTQNIPSYQSNLECTIDNNNNNNKKLAKHNKKQLIYEPEDSFCDIRVKDKDNVVHLTNLNGFKWTEDKIRNVLKSINPYWNEKKINIYIFKNKESNLLTASIEFKSREYSEKAMELIESNFNLFMSSDRLQMHNKPTLSNMKMNNIKSPIDYVTGIKLKLYKPNINTNKVFTCYGQTCIPLKFDLKMIIANYYNLYCCVETKLEYYQNKQLYQHIPNTNDIEKYLYKCKFPQIFNHNKYNNKNISKNLILSIYFPFLNINIIHGNNKYFCYITGHLILLYQLNNNTNKYILKTQQQISPNRLSEILYLDILSLIDTTGNYTFFDTNNNNFECDLYKPIGYDLNDNENIEPYKLLTMKLPTNNYELDRCVICLNKISEYEFTRISSCKHLFHYQCIKQLLQYNKNINQQIWDTQLNTYILCNYAYCPLCRRKFTSIQSRICIHNQHKNQKILIRPTVQYINVTDMDILSDNEKSDDDDDDDDDIDDIDDEYDTDHTDNSDNSDDSSTSSVSGSGSGSGSDSGSDSGSISDDEETINYTHNTHNESYSQYDAVYEEAGTEVEAHQLDDDDDDDDDEYNEYATSYYESFDEH